MNIPNPLPLAANFLGGIQTYLIVGAVSAAVAFAGGSYAGYRWELGTYKSLVAADALAENDALNNQAIIDGQQATVTLNAAVAEQKAQDKLHPVYITIHERIPVYVTSTQDARSVASCGISVGFVRVLRASEDSVTPEALQLAAGQSDDDCADITPSTLADSLSQTIGAGVKNAEQLNALIAEIKANHKAQEIVP